MGYLIVAAYTVVIAFGAGGNLLTIVAVLRNKQMQTLRNFFVFNLALSDLFICLCTAPVTLYTVYFVFWPFPSFVCKVAGSLQGASIFLSTFSLTAIALERQVAACWLLAHSIKISLLQLRTRHLSNKATATTHTFNRVLLAYLAGKHPPCTTAIHRERPELNL